MRPQPKLGVEKQVKDLATTVRKNWGAKGRVMATTKKVWDKPNPKRKSTPLTASQKAAAKARAKKAGRPYPNLIDNMAVSKKAK